YLVCDNAHRRVPDSDFGDPMCEERDLMPLGPLEDAVLGGITGLLIDKRQPRSPRIIEIEDELGKLSDAVALKRRSLDAAMEKFDEDAELLQSISRVTAGIKADQKRHSDLQRELSSLRGATSSSDAGDLIRDLREDAQSDDPDVRLVARLKISAALRSVVNDMWVDTTKDKAGLVLGPLLFVVVGGRYGVLKMEAKDILDEFKDLPVDHPRLVRFQRVMSRMTKAEYVDSSGNEMISFAVPGDPDDSGRAGGIVLLND
ncbi:hypothetical protein ACLF3G_28355, partial [Falsiroseomonas sp. HC035]|uniref:hypothetical protein n=1 Tax=Falsiroseomonas sp. HC035 TaxID=3390999 RepID=UPI003D3175B9